jgi:hypothetical protein
MCGGWFYGGVASWQGSHASGAPPAQEERATRNTERVPAPASSWSERNVRGDVGLGWVLPFPSSSAFDRGASPFASHLWLVEG